MAPDIRVSRPVKIAFGIMLAVTILIGTVDNIGAVSRWENRADITDFHAFYIVGRLIWSGQFAQAYRASSMLALETALGGRHVFMPWSYPPLFGAVVAGFAALPIGPAFVAFVSTTLGLYVWAVRRLDPDGHWPVLLASTVGIVLNLRSGQNGLLTAALVAGASAVLLGGRPARAGLGLALMAIKPHLIPLLPLALVAQRRWRTLAVAGVGAAALTGLGVAMFGWPVSAAFIQALPEVGRLMVLGAYPLHRMTSIFAFGVAAGLPGPAAMAIHAMTAVAVLSATGLVALRRPDPRLRLGLAIMAGFFVSPYIYDYDQVLFGVGLLLVGPALRQCVPLRRYGTILAGWALAHALGLLLNHVLGLHQDVSVSPMGPALLAAFCAILRPLWRPHPATAAAHDLPAAAGA